MHGLFILPLLSARDLDIGPRDDISRGLITRAIWKRPCINLFITYFWPGQITCYCPRKMLFPWGQITRRKLCFYYTCKFGVISIKYVIILCTKGVNSNPGEGEYEMCQLKNIILTLLIFIFKVNSVIDMSC